jgi:hypothetical protein
MVSYIKQSILEDTWELSSSHFHLVYLIRVRYFDNLICGWTGARVLFSLEQATLL